MGGERAEEEGERKGGEEKRGGSLRIPSHVIPSSDAHHNMSSLKNDTSLCLFSNKFNCCVRGKTGGNGVLYKRLIYNM